MGGKDQLFFKAKQVHGCGAVLAVERTQGLNLFGMLNQCVTHGELSGHMFLRMPTTLTHDHPHLFIGDHRCRVADFGNFITQIRICISL